MELINVQELRQDPKARKTAIKNLKIVIFLGRFTNAMPIVLTALMVCTAFMAFVLGVLAPSIADVSTSLGNVDPNLTAAEIASAVSHFKTASYIIGVISLFLSACCAYSGVRDFRANNIRIERAEQALKALLLTDAEKAQYQSAPLGETSIRKHDAEDAAQDQTE